MKKPLLTIIAFIFSFILSSHAWKKNDEGMFLLSDLKNINLQKAGLKMTPLELYNPNGTSLIDAIVRVGGCTGSFVSGEGLIVTNHHCAFGFVQAISTTRNNYIRNGFLAKSHAEEVQARGLICKITVSYEDVSSKVLKGTKEIADAGERLKLIASNMNAITVEENTANKNLQCEVSEMFTGKTYILFRYKMLKDVRVVYVPARSIGEYGGEADNWVWPRHSGDFAFLRAYVAPDGSASEYNERNIPFKPAKFLKVNPKGVNADDFVFVLGYPGRTFRHQPAAFYKYHEQYMLKYISDLFDWQINEMESLGKDNDSIQIRYSGRMKSLANVTKNYKGKLQGFKRAGLTAQKYEEERRLQEYVNSNAELKAKYGNVIPRINELYSGIIQHANRNLWFGQAYSLLPTLGFASTLSTIQDQYFKQEKGEKRNAYLNKMLPKLKAARDKFAGLYDPSFEKAAWVKMIGDARSFNADNKIFWLAEVDKAAGNKTIPDYIDLLFKKTQLNQFDKLTKLFDKSPQKLMEIKDPLIDLVSKLTSEVIMDDADEEKRDAELNQLMAKYVEMKSEWIPGQFIPDANGTLRFTYGYIKGYSPNDADYNEPITTLKGVIEKEDGKEFELLQVIKELYAARDYGDFIHPGLNELPVDILYNLDTTGGNSGSPVMNAYGELIGVNFDRAYSATINDYAWNESYSRSVAVDIRYVLWILQKVAKAQHIIDEMGIGKG